MPSRRLLLLPALAALLAASGCRDAKIATYRVPRETPPPAAANAQSADPHAGLGIPPVNAASSPAPAMPTDMASTAVPTASGGDLSWTTPANWQSRAASAMRKATFIIPGESAGEQAELAVTAFPGDVGGNLANVNRWRQQLQLAPISASELDSALTHLHAGDLHIDVAELLGPVPADGKPRQRVLGAIVPFNGATWFFKLTGPDALVSREKSAYLAFVQTIRPSR
ncbi:hypothetical protein [Rariglobus hedericola]|uniref:Uncharacterized protein n=1 Tax=Rariglobus hedericola TaxID=2597822 RepID=A0A556QNF5_9BACT|nr:hypothetical protein [Rariglobus hedericola]TSJ78159.1 hypothetical protein FPL22_02295 [Rariglobus hedericola]